MAEKSENILEVQDITKTFPGVRALDSVDWSLKRGEIHALVGENGAGKSTLMHILGGVIQPDSGEIFIDGEIVKFSNPHSAALHGIAIVFQELSVLENLSVAENIFANRQPANLINIINRRSLYEQSSKILQLFNLDIDASVLLREISPDQHQVIEILKAISQNVKVLILDEPTSSLSSEHVKVLFKIIRKLKQDGISIIYISHHLREVFEIADTVTILRDGRKVDTCPVSSVTEEDLVRKMVGREITDMYGSPLAPPLDECFRIENASRAGVFKNISFSILKGQIVGLAGLSGAGRTALARSIFGIEPIDTGSIFMQGKPVKISSPTMAIRNRIAYITEDRKEQGLFLDMTIRENCVAPSLNCFTERYGLIDENAVSDFAEYYRINLNIVTPDIRQKVANLSGGNQQKVLLSMWMGIKPLLLIVDEPTKGIDVGAKNEIYRLLRQLAAEGVAILLISSDLLEILGLSDRILVIRTGSIVAEFTRQQATEENIIAAASEVSLKEKINAAE